MRSNENKERIAGYLYGLDDGNGRDALTKRQSGANSKNPGTDYIAGTILVAVDEDGLNIIPVHFTYVTKTYSSGKENRTYGVLEQILGSGKTWTSVGKENALKVRIDASLALNEFYAQDGSLVAAKRNEGSFVNIVNGPMSPASEHNRFTTDMVITNVTHVDADEEKNVTEHAVVRGCVFDFRNAILPVEFLIRNAQGMKYFEGLDANDSNPVYTKVWGKINCSSVTYEEKTESAFGEPILNTRTRRTREWEITGAAEEPFNFGDEGVLTVEELTKAMQDRQVHLADVKKRADEYAASKATPPETATPINTKPVMPKGGFKF